MTRDTQLHHLTCQWCGTEIPRKDPTAPGVQRKWCSGRCRRAACADSKRKSCVECGEPLSTGSAWPSASGHNPNGRCNDCHQENKRQRHQEKVQKVAEMYNAGKSFREIAEALGYGPESTPPEINEARTLGLIGRRYSAERVENMRTGRWGEAA